MEFFCQKQDSQDSRIHRIIILHFHPGNWLIQSRLVRKDEGIVIPVKTGIQILANKFATTKMKSFNSSLDTGLLAGMARAAHRRWTRGIYISPISPLITSPVSCTRIFTGR